MPRTKPEDSKNPNQMAIEIAGKFTARYALRSVENPKELILLLHGYSQSGDFFFKKLEESLPADAVILSPNAPFPVPERQGDVLKIGFAWYFYESSTDEYYIDPELAQSYLSTLIEKLNLSHLPKKIIGYSQGGYLAPFVGLKLSQVKKIIGINCQFLHEELPKNFPFAIDGINGIQDEVVDPQNAKRSHEFMISNGNKGKFTLVSGVGHGLSAGVLAELRHSLKEERP